MSEHDQLIARAEQLMAGSDAAAARTLLESDASALASSYAVAWLHGWVCFQLHDFDAAIASLGRAGALDPEHPEPHYALGVVYGQLDEVATAERYLRRALDLADSFEARFELAFLYHRQNRLMEAEALHRENADLYPELGDAHIALADFLGDTGRERDARAHYERAMALGEDAPR